MERAGATQRIGEDVFLREGEGRREGGREGGSVGAMSIETCAMDTKGGRGRRRGGREGGRK